MKIGCGSNSKCDCNRISAIYKCGDGYYEGINASGGGSGQKFFTDQEIRDKVTLNKAGGKKVKGINLINGNIGAVSESNSFFTGVWQGVKDNFTGESGQKFGGQLVNLGLGFVGNALGIKDEPPPVIIQERPDYSKYFIYGGLGIAGLVAIYLITKKK